MLGSREISKPENCLKMPQNPTCPVHALLGGVCGQCIFYALTVEVEKELAEVARY
jgi:hypothetical protein